MYLKIMKLLLFLYTLCLYIVNTLNLDLLRSIISKFDNFCVYLEKKVFVKYMGKTFNQLYYWPQRWHFWEIEGSCLMKFPSEECFKICQFFWNILCYFNFFPKEASFFLTLFHLNCKTRHHLVMYGSVRLN